uniref:BPI1 domain-containing protein n=1 Tax=Rhabditophanes sp. KR3021 TaxID=114890 RepID=A0AC35U7S4_9BILA
MYTKLFAFLAVVAVAYASSCTDGTNNVIDIGDVSNGAYNAHFQNVVAQTYNSDGSPSCYKGAASLKLPGVLKLVSGTIVVKTSMNLINDANAKMTLKKDSFLIGKICDDGKSKNALIPSSDCSIDICSQSYETSICKLMETAGTHDLATLEKTLGFSATINLPALPSSINGIIKGQWQAGLDLINAGQTVADIKLPSNEKYISIEQ